MTIEEMRDMEAQLNSAIVHSQKHLAEAKHNDKREYFKSLIIAQENARNYYTRRIEEVGFDNIEEFSK